MNFQNDTLPEKAVKVGSTPSMDEVTVVKGILKNHLAPKGKYGLVVVEEGTLKFVWEDDASNVLDADSDHPIIIYPDRFHHVVIDGPVKFRVEFYQVPVDVVANNEGERPGEDFLDK